MNLKKHFWFEHSTTGGNFRIKGWIHQIFSPICFTKIFLSLSGWKWEQSSYGSKTGFLFSVYHLKSNHNKYSLSKFVDSKFEIGEWWNYLMNSYKSFSSHSYIGTTSHEKRKIRWEIRRHEMQCLRKNLLELEKSWSSYVGAH